MQHDETCETAGQPSRVTLWRHRKKAAAEAGREQEARQALERRKALIDGWTSALGGNVGELQLRDLERAADMEGLAERARAACLRGEVSIGDMTRLEIQAAKAVKRLGLPVAGAAVAPVRSLADYLAGDGDG